MARALGLDMKLFDPGHRRDFGKGQRLALVGTELTVSILIGLFGGHWLDGRLGSRPWLTLLGLLLGVAAGFNSLLRVARREQARIDRQAAREAADKQPKTDPTDPPT
ncbi:MAG: hypothetical protein OHK0013_18250 [Sandaracinaceae bacterium]